MLPEWLKALQTLSKELRKLWRLLFEWELRMQMSRLTRRLKHPLKAPKTDKKVEDTPGLALTNFEKPGAPRTAEKLWLHSTRELKLPLKDSSIVLLLES